MNKDFKKFSLLDESIKTVASDSTSPIPESVEEAAVKHKMPQPLFDFTQHLAEVMLSCGCRISLMPNQSGTLKFHMAHEINKFYECQLTHHSAEVERLRERISELETKLQKLIDANPRYNEGYINNVIRKYQIDENK
jgi:hypothetical protein